MSCVFSCPGFITRSPIVVSGEINSEDPTIVAVETWLGNRRITCSLDNKGHFFARFNTKPGFKCLKIMARLPDGRYKPVGKRLIYVWGRSDKVISYAQWLQQNGRSSAPPPKTGPKISVLMPVYNTPERWLNRAIESVREQTYPNWELCIANDASTEPQVQRILDEATCTDTRIKVIHRPVNGHISAASNSALSLAAGGFLALLDHDDELAPEALSEIVHAIQKNPTARILYSDEDKIDGKGVRSSPYFKPDWNPDLLRGQNYFCHLTVYEANLLHSLGGFRVGYEGAQDWDLALRAIEKVEAFQIVHIPKVLYHWRAIPGSTALSLSQKDYHQQAAKLALEDHVRRAGLQAEVIPVKGGHWRLKYRLPEQPPKVSIIIPTRNGLRILRPCVTAILEKSTYQNFEVIIVDNASDDPLALQYLAVLAEDKRVKVIRDANPFNYSALNNRAVPIATGEIIALVNNDIEPITPDWLEEMVSLAIRPGTGAVGCMLYYPNNTVQHAGVILGISGPHAKEGVAGHAFKNFRRGDGGQMNRLRLLQNYSAVTAACLVIRKTIFEEVGGLDELNLPISFNDVDFCLRVLKAGYRNVWTPFAELYHHESASRGKEDTPEKRARAQREINYMLTSWRDALNHDPAYNPNLTLVREDFTLSDTQY